MRSDPAYRTVIDHEDGLQAMSAAAVSTLREVSVALVIIAFTAQLIVHFCHSPLVLHLSAEREVQELRRNLSATLSAAVVHDKTESAAFGLQEGEETCAGVETVSTLQYY